MGTGARRTRERSLFGHILGGSVSAMPVLVFFITVYSLPIVLI